MVYPLFSVLISNYNNGSYIQETLESIFKQTYTNWEIIIVDDASTDGSKIIYDRLKDNPRIKIFFNEENRGVGYTKRKCIEYATGDICGFVDPDDALVPNALEVMVEAHYKFKDAGLIYSEAYYCDQNLNVIEELSIQRHRLIQKESYLHEENYIVGHFATFKRTSYLATPGMNEAYKRAVDQDLYYLLEEVSCLEYIDKFLYLYRVHDKGVSSVGINTIKAFSWHIAVIIDTCKRRNLEFENIVAEKINFHMRGSNDVQLQKQIQMITNSYSYKIGRVITKVLYPVKRIFKK